MKKSKAQKDREFWYEQGKRDERAKLAKTLRDLLDVPSRKEAEDIALMVANSHGDPYL